MPISTSRATATRSITAGIAVSLHLGRGARERGVQRAWVNSIPLDWRVSPGPDRRLARAPQPSAAGSRHAWRRTAIDLRGRRQRQDARADGPNRLPDRLEAGLAGPPG